MAAFDEQDLVGIRRGLLAYCYQLLGSPFDAEDAVQDALERIWRSRDSFSSATASLSTWCYRIAHNICVDRIRAAPRRPLPRDLADPGIEVGAPLVPALDVPWLMPAPSGWSIPASDVELTVQRRADVRLAVTAMLQTLSPLQRGAFVLREVIGLSATDAAVALDTSVAAVNSALQRARAAVQAGAPRPHDLAPSAVERYAQAIERADVEALAALVAEDVVLEMPPVPQWSRGRVPFTAFIACLFEWRGTSWSTAPISANGQPGFLLYRVTPEGRTPHTLQLFDGDGVIDHVLVYQNAPLFELFEKESVGER